MKTWFCKDTQKWVSEVPRSFWLGIRDYKTGEKIYSDEPYYEKYVCPYDDSDCSREKWKKVNNERIMTDCSRFYERFGYYPGIDRIRNYIFKKL